MSAPTPAPAPSSAPPAAVQPVVSAVLDLARKMWTAAKRGGTYKPTLNAQDHLAVRPEFDQANNLVQVPPPDHGIAPQNQRHDGSQRGPISERGRNGGGGGRGGDQLKQQGPGGGQKKPLRANRTPPPAGAPQRKNVNGKTYHWCVRCNRWCVSHGQPTAPEGVGHGASHQQANTGIYQDSSAWNDFRTSECKRRLTSIEDVGRRPKMPRSDYKYELWDNKLRF